MARILAFAGSARVESFNRAVIGIAADGARAAGAEVTVLDMREFPMPLYDGDLESTDGLPERARALKALFLEHDGLLIASPEYNSSISPLLKNTIDWISRAEEGESPLAAYAGKVAGLVAASPGALGGLRGLSHLREILHNIRVTVVPHMTAVPNVHRILNEDRTALTDERLDGAVRAVGAAVAGMTTTLAARTPE